MVAASGRLPQLSGFYHLITTAMQLSMSAGLLNKAHHLRCLPTCRTAHRDMLVKSAEAALKASCSTRLFINVQEVESNAADGARLVVMLSAYLRDLLTASRQYSDELLAAALKLLLSAPVFVLPPQVWLHKVLTGSCSGTLAISVTRLHTGTDICRHDCLLRRMLWRRCRRPWPLGCSTVLWQTMLCRPWSAGNMRSPRYETCIFFAICLHVPSCQRCGYRVYPSSSLKEYCCAEPSLVKYAGAAAAGATSAAAVGPIPPGGRRHGAGSSD